MPRRLQLPLYLPFLPPTCQFCRFVLDAATCLLGFCVLPDYRRHRCCRFTVLILDFCYRFCSYLLLTACTCLPAACRSHRSAAVLPFCLPAFCGCRTLLPPHTCTVLPYRLPPADCSTAPALVLDYRLCRSRSATAVLCQFGFHRFCTVRYTLPAYRSAATATADYTTCLPALYVTVLRFCRSTVTCANTVRFTPAFFAVLVLFSAVSRSAAFSGFCLDFLVLRSFSTCVLGRLRKQYLHLLHLPACLPALQHACAVLP